MQGWGWLVAYVVGFGLLQLLLYRYLQQRGPTAGSTPGHTGRGGSVQADTTADGTAGVCCDECGTVNEAGQTIQYCRSCTAPLR